MRMTSLTQQYSSEDVPATEVVHRESAAVTHHQQRVR